MTEQVRHGQGLCMPPALVPRGCTNQQTTLVLSRSVDAGLRPSELAAPKSHQKWHCCLARLPSTLAGTQAVRVRVREPEGLEFGLPGSTVLPSLHMPHGRN